MQTTPKTVTKTKAVMTANKQTAPELHLQTIPWFLQPFIKKTRMIGNSTQIPFPRNMLDRIHNLIHRRLFVVK
jgi:hypothetical protein